MFSTSCRGDLSTTANVGFSGGMRCIHISPSLLLSPFLFTLFQCFLYCLALFTLQPSTLYVVWACIFCFTRPSRRRRGRWAGGVGKTAGQGRREGWARRRGRAGGGVRQGGGPAGQQPPRCGPRAQQQPMRGPRGAPLPPRCGPRGAATAAKARPQQPPTRGPRGAPTAAQARTTRGHNSRHCADHNGPQHPPRWSEVR